MGLPADHFILLVVNNVKVHKINVLTSTNMSYSYKILDSIMWIMLQLSYSLEFWKTGSVILSLFWAYFFHSCQPRRFAHNVK